MGRSTKPINTYVWIGRGIVFLILILTLGTLIAVYKEADFFSGLTLGDWAAIKFTLKQAFLSAFISCLLSVPIARALARRQFFGKNFLISILGAPFILPVLIAILGLISIFGNNGFLNNLLMSFNLPKISIYGLHGIIIAHVFFNLPLATRLLLHGWLSIPSERFRLSGQLGFKPLDIFKYLEYPMLRDVLPGVFTAIFLICITSFAVALALGGGPRTTTIELAIYQAFRFDFNLSKAALLALVQFSLCIIITIFAFKFTVSTNFGTGMDRYVVRWDSQTIISKLVDVLLIFLISLFIFTPIAAIVFKGIPNIFSMPTEVWPSTYRSIIMALISSLLSVTMALGLSLAIVKSEHKEGLLFEGSGYLTIAISPMVTGTGLFIIILPFSDPKSLALAVTVIVNSSMSLPFAMRAILPTLRRINHNYNNLTESLGMSNWSSMKYVILPRLSIPLGFSAGLSAAISMGDFGVIALFSDPGKTTLPMVLYQLMSSYRINEAASAATVLLFLSFAIFWLFDRIGRLNARN
jgi:thiamine transport system permease protein